MLGVNIAQSQKEEEEIKPKRGGFFDTGTIVSIVLISLAGLVWGGIQFYISTLDKKIATVDTALAMDSGRLVGEEIDRVADFDARISYFADKQKELMEPLDMMTKLEESMVSGIVLTEYEYKHEGSVGNIHGVASNFRVLAEQILAFKSTGLFSEVKVEKTERDQEGQLRFVLEATL